MELDTEESSWKWVVAIACFCMNFITLGLRRSTAVVYVALLPAFGITREQAAWPTALCSSTIFLFGPLSGFLTSYFAIRTIVFYGCATASLAVFLCYFGHSLVFIIIFFGAVQGFGIGLVCTLNPVIINQYFKKHKASATGFSFAGASIGSMVLPPLTDYLLKEYGLHGCFLLLSGIIMQGLVAASLYRPPNIAANKASKPRIQEGEVLMISPDTVQVKIIAKESQKLKSNFVHKLRNATEVLMHPSFAIICLNYTSFFVCHITLAIVFMDFALDRGIGERDALLCITAFAVADLVGRLFTGWISDFKFIRTKYLVTINLLVIAVLFMVVELISNYAAILCWSVALGVEIGCVLIIFPVLMREYLGLEQLPMAVGFSGFSVGCATLALPALIGLFRDSAGSYDHLFQTLGALAAFSALLWILKPVFQLCTKPFKVVTSKPTTFRCTICK